MMNKVKHNNQYVTIALYTNGNEFVYNSNELDYVGWYHLYDNGDIYSQPTFDSNLSVKLKPKDNGINGEFNKINGSYFLEYQKYKTISPFLPLPTDDDYSNGSIIRYFCRKSNDLKSPITEISKTDFQILNEYKNNFMSILHTTHSLRWKISGRKDDVYDSNNIRIYSGVYDINKRTLVESEKVFPDITSYLSNLLQFYDSSK